jgi:hypothetical protein
MRSLLAVAKIKDDGNAGSELTMRLRRNEAKFTMAAFQPPTSREFTRFCLRIRDCESGFHVQDVHADAKLFCCSA